MASLSVLFQPESSRYKQLKGMSAFFSTIQVFSLFPAPSNGSRILGVVKVHIEDLVQSIDTVFINRLYNSNIKMIQLRTMIAKSTKTLKAHNMK